MLFQPFKGATQRQGSAVSDALAKAQMEKMQREIQGQNIAGAAALAQWGLGKDTSPWADSIYGEETPVAENPVSTALRAPETPATAMPTGTTAVDMALNQQAQQQDGGLAGLLPSAAMGAASLMTGNPMGALPFAMNAYNMIG